MGPLAQWIVDICSCPWYVLLLSIWISMPQCREGHQWPCLILHLHQEIVQNIVRQCGAHGVDATGYKVTTPYKLSYSVVICCHFVTRLQYSHTFNTQLLCYQKVLWVPCLVALKVHAVVRTTQGFHTIIRSCESHVWWHRKYSMCHCENNLRLFFEFEAFTRL